MKGYEQFAHCFPFELRRHSRAAESSNNRFRWPPGRDDPVFLDYLAKVDGPSVTQRFKSSVAFNSFFNFEWRGMTPEERRERRAMKSVWWAGPTRNTRDLATSFFPKLFYERMEEMGIDISVVYPTLGLITILISDEEVRRAACRALNRMKADMFADFTDRLIPVATIPMHTPQEAIEELEFAVKELGKLCTGRDSATM